MPMPRTHTHVQLCPSPCGTHPEDCFVQGFLQRLRPPTWAQRDLAVELCQEYFDQVGDLESDCSELSLRALAKVFEGRCRVGEVTCIAFVLAAYLQDLGKIDGFQYRRQCASLLAVPPGGAGRHGLIRAA